MIAHDSYDKSPSLQSPYIPWIEVAIADEEGKELGMSRAAGQQGTLVLFLWAENVLGEENMSNKPYLNSGVVPDHGVKDAFILIGKRGSDSYSRMLDCIGRDQIRECRWERDGRLSFFPKLKPRRSANSSLSIVLFAFWTALNHLSSVITWATAHYVPFSHTPTTVVFPGSYKPTAHSFPILTKQLGHAFFQVKANDLFWTVSSGHIGGLP